MRRGDIAVIAIALTIIGVVQGPHQSRVVGASAMSTELCNRIPGLNKIQREICKKMPSAMPAIGEGAELGLSECRYQFRHHRWNCSHVTNDRVFGHIVVVGSREAAFTYAISSAGITYAITAACSRGNITACGCEPAVRTKKTLPPNGWEWGGCSADVTYGMRFARRFLDAREVEGDARSLMNLHNNRAGRKMVKAMLQTECKCHGVSGSCTVRTCWKKLPSFRQIGDALMKKYYRARTVISATPPPSPTIKSTYYQDQEKENFKKGQSILGNDARILQQMENEILKPSSTNRRNIIKSSDPKQPYLILKRANDFAMSSIVSQKRIPKQSELVFLHTSPNYCETDYTKGSMGTQGRACNRSSKATDGCDLMCCGRGYNTHQYTKTWQCRCKFHWCCRVNCDTCTERTEEYTCK